MRCSLGVTISHREQPNSENQEEMWSVGRIIVKEPPAKSLITGIRAIGYNFSTAVADIIDNSISAKASRIDIITDVTDKSSYVAFLDNGCGMNYEELENAMLLGSNRDNRTDSDTELGRFGLGLKSASLSQCREFTVVSKVSGKVNAIMFDLNLIEAENKWDLCVLDQEEIQAIHNVDKLLEYSSGTLVVWKAFDKIENRAKKYEDSFREAVADAKRHVPGAEQRHLLFDHFTLLLGNAKLELNLPLSVRHCQRSSASCLTAGGVAAALVLSSFFRTDGLRWRSGWSRFSSFWMNAKIPFRSLSVEKVRDLNGSMANSRSWSLVEARIIKSGESCAMKCVPPGLFGSRSVCSCLRIRAASH